LRGQAEKQGAPKLSAALNFLWLLSLFQDKESDNRFGGAKEPNKVSSPKANEQ
jgi:hypothetical protein